MENCDCELSFQTIFLTHLFTTLGQLTAGVLSASVAVPVLSYYSSGVRQFWFGKQC